jgi:CheY-like chemotaxis protein
VLIVEDEPTVRDVWQRSLSALGYETIAVEDAQQALPLLSSAPFVAICDVHLPGASGLWLIEQIRTASPIPQSSWRLRTSRSPPFRVCEQTSSRIWSSPFVLMN